MTRYNSSAVAERVPESRVDAVTEGLVATGEAVVSPFAAVPFPTDATVLSAVAQELGAPLTALVTSAELLVEDFEGLPREQMREMLSSLHIVALRLHGLVENLLAAATVKEGRLRIHPKAVALLDIISEVDPVVAPLLGQKQQRLQVTALDPLPDVPADPRRLGQVLVNLILNASKYSDANTAVEVTLRNCGNHVWIGVSDEGPGVSEDAMARIFEPFFRSAPPAGSGTGGVGLGLSIVRSIVEAHGGCVGVANRPVRGACFWFELPLSGVAFASRVDWVNSAGGRL